MTPNASPDTLGGGWIDDLAQEIRRVDGNNDKGAGALAEALMPFLAALYAAPSPMGKTDGEAVAEARGILERALAIVADLGNKPEPRFVDRALSAILAALSNPAQALPDGEAVIAAARNMPRRTPKIGGCSTIHDVQIEACHIWALDKTLTEYDAALSKPSSRNGDPA